jgi:hypothetical protein
MYKTQKKEQFSIAFIKAIAAPLGFNPARFEIDDDSVDIVFTSKGYIGKKKRNPQINIQMKCTKMLQSGDGYLHYNLPLKNYDDLRGYDQANPSYLVVVCVPDNEDEWVTCNSNDITLKYSGYWISLRDFPETKNDSTVNIKIPITQKLNKESLQFLMDKASEGIML